MLRVSGGAMFCVMKPEGKVAEIFFEDLFEQFRGDLVVYLES